MRLISTYDLTPRTSLFNANKQRNNKTFPLHNVSTYLDCSIVTCMTKTEWRGGYSRAGWMVEEAEKRGDILSVVLINTHVPNYNYHFPILDKGNSKYCLLFHHYRPEWVEILH